MGLRGFHFPTNRRNGIHRFPLLLADNLRINLRDTDVGMPQKLADGIKLGTVGQAESGKGMTSHVEGNTLADAGTSRPLFQQFGSI